MSIEFHMLLDQALEEGKIFFSKQGLLLLGPD